MLYGLLEAKPFSPPCECSPMLLSDILMAAFAGFWFFLAAYAANPCAVLFGGGRPMDGGRTHKDGRRLLGDGKTWKGTVGGTICGIVLGLLAAGAADLAGVVELSYGTLLQVLWACFLLAFGSMCGDITGSYVKRRLGRKRGARTPILDQYDFFIGSILFLLVGYSSWFTERYWDGPGKIGLLTILILTPILHRVVNIIGHKMGKKDVPW